jgi:hypothetical protein
MKLTMKWGGKVRNRKTFKPEPKIRWDLLGLADPAKEKIPMPIDEVRRQVLMMSSPGLGLNSSARLETTPKKDSRVPTSAKRVRKPRRGASN